MLTGEPGKHGLCIANLSCWSCARSGPMWQTPNCLISEAQHCAADFIALYHLSGALRLPGGCAASNTDSGA